MQILRETNWEGGVEILGRADPRGNHANLVRLNGVSEYIIDLVLKKWNYDPEKRGENGPVTLKNDKKMT